MSLIKKINDPNGKQYDDFSIGSLVLDTEPIPGSFNTITSDAVVKAIDKAKDDMQEKIDEVTLDPSAVALGNVHLLDEVTEFPADGCILVDSEANGPAKMSKDTLLELTAQNALAGNVAHEFVPNSTTTVAGLPYVYGGKMYVAKVTGYQGSWDASKFDAAKVSSIFAPSHLVPNLGYHLTGDYHFSITGGNKIDDLTVNTTVYPIGDICQNRPLAIENSSNYGFYIAFLTSDPTQLESGSAVDLCEGTTAQVVYNKRSKLLDVPKDCEYIVVWNSVSAAIGSVKVYSPAGVPNKNEIILHPDSFWYDERLNASSSQVSRQNAGDYITLRYDISNVSEFYINYESEFPLNSFFEGFKSAAITDEDGYIIDTIDDLIVKSANNYLLKVKNKPYLNSFVGQSGSSYSAKYLYITYKVVDTGSSYVTVSTAPIYDDQKCFKKLSPSSYHPGEFFYGSGYLENWRACADVYDVAGLKEVLIEHGCYAGGGIYEFIFKLSDNSYQNVFARGSYTKYDSRLMVPVPSDAVQLIVNSSVTPTKKSYHRTKVYSYEGGNYGDSSFDKIFKPVQTIDLFFIGNSLTQDAVSYLPMLLKEVCPYIEYNIYIWYNGGYTLKRQWEDKIDPDVDAACEIFSVCHTDIGWANYQVKMSAILGYVHVDYLVLQEYFNNIESYSDADTQYFNNIVDYISSNTPSKFEVDCLFHAPKRGADFDTIYQRTKDGNITILKNTAAVDIFVPGCAIYEACSTSLDSLGDLGHLSPDGIHAQEGLPCQLEAYVMLLQVLKKLGMPMSVEGLTTIVDTTNYASINVPGPNLGNGVVVGTSEQYALAKRVAAYSTNKRFAIMSDTF